MNEPTDKKSVLVVDDEAINIGLLAQILKGIYKVKVAKDGEKALKIAAATPSPDLILLDVMMPGMDGFEVHRRLREQLPELDPRVIFVTARGDVDDILRGFEGGCVDYITKPFRQEEVCVRVQTHLELRQANRQLQALNEQRLHWLAWSPMTCAAH